MKKAKPPRPQNKNLKPLKPGFDPRRNVNGRPRKFVSQFAKDFGYTQSQVLDTMNALLACDRGELQQIMNDKGSTALEAAVARALIKSMDTGDLSKIETVVTRVYGAPKQYIEDTTPPVPTSVEIDFNKLSDSALREIAAATIKK